MRTRKIVPPPVNMDCVNLSSEEMTQSLEIIAKGLESRFSSTMPNNWQKGTTATDFEKVTMAEVSDVIRHLPSSAPGPPMELQYR